MFSVPIGRKTVDKKIGSAAYAVAVGGFNPEKYLDAELFADFQRVIVIGEVKFELFPVWKAPVDIYVAV